MRTVFAAGLLALGGLMTTGVAVANADEVQVEGVYSTEAACEVDGPHVEIVYDNRKIHPLGLPRGRRRTLVSVPEQRIVRPQVRRESDQPEGSGLLLAT